MKEYPNSLLYNLINKIRPPKRMLEKIESLASCLTTGALESQVEYIRDNLDDFNGREKKELELQLSIFEKELANRSGAA